MKRIGAALLISAAFVSQAAFAAFTSGMSASALQAEIRAQQTQGKSALEIARAALAPAATQTPAPVAGSNSRTLSTCRGA